MYLFIKTQLQFFGVIYIHNKNIYKFVGRKIMFDIILAILLYVFTFDKFEFPKGAICGCFAIH